VKGVVGFTCDSEGFKATSGLYLRNRGVKGITLSKRSTEQDKCPIMMLEHHDRFPSVNQPRKLQDENF
jgi:hypothetical protein